MNLNVIPQIFYDIIVRLIPGTLIALLLGVAWISPSRIAEHPDLYVSLLADTGLGIIFILLILAYYLSSFFNELYNFCCKPPQQWFPGGKAQTTSSQGSKCLGRAIEEFENLQKALKTPPASYQKTADKSAKFPDIMVVHNYLRLVHPIEANRLMKIHAEGRFAKTMASALALIAGLFFILLFAHHPWNGLNIFFLLFLLAGSMLSRQRLHKLDDYFANGTLGAFFVDTFLDVSEKGHGLPNDTTDNQEQNKD